jgi:glycosyltransferase involved in cell wall biosynthesis
MKILIHDYAGHPFQVDLSRELAKRGHDVVHAYFAGDPGPKGTLARRPDDAAGLRFAGVNIDRPYNKGSMIERRFNDIRYGKEAAKLIVEVKPDVVISGNTPTEAQSHVIKACKAADAAYVQWVQDFYSIAASKLLTKKLGLPGALVGAYYRWIERRQLAGSHGVVTITEDFEPLATKWAGDAKKVVTIENWGALGDIAPQPKDNAWARENGIDGKLTFLYSGTLGLKHNPHFISALAKAFGDSANVVVAGQGLGFDALKETVAKEKLASVKLLPLQPFARLSELLGSADILVSVVESDAGMFSVPSKVQSYLCAGRPILLAAPPENLAARIVARENAGLAMHPNDLDGFISAARKLADDAALRRTLGENGRDYAERAYDILRTTDRFEQVFEAAVRRAARRSPLPVMTPKARGEPVD